MLCVFKVHMYDSKAIYSKVGDNMTITLQVKKNTVLKLIGPLWTCQNNNTSTNISCLAEKNIFINFLETANVITVDIYLVNIKLSDGGDYILQSSTDASCVDLFKDSCSLTSTTMIVCGMKLILAFCKL